MTVGGLLLALLGGTAVGLLGTLAVPAHHDGVPLWLLVLTGVAAVAAVELLWSAVRPAQGVGEDWWQHGTSLAVAGVLVTLVARRTGRHPH